MIVFNNISLKRGQTELLDNAVATITPKQKVGLVGKNGCGKSSLLALLKKELQPEGGDVTYPSNWAVSWVNQETPALDVSAIDYVIQGDREYCRLQQELAWANEQNDGNAIARIHDRLDAINAWTIRSRAETLLHGLGFTQVETSHAVKSFSGGWRMRLNLAQALLCPSDLLLLDEPTNHLDLEAVIWLERWLVNYQGTLVLISHDRDFLDPIVNKILHIEHQKLNEYTGDYSSFEVQRATKLAQQVAMYRQQQQKIAHLQNYIDRFKAKATKAKQAQSRVKALERMELIAPAYADNPFTFAFRSPATLPSPLVMIEQASAGYGEGESVVEILSKIKLNLVPGSRIGLLGKNGAGKSTLIKLLAGELTALSGNVQLAKGVQLGYFAQHQLDTLRAEESALWHMQKIAPEQTEQQVRDYLGSFAFHGDKVNQAVKSFSGGEKARLVLALIVWQRPNLLLLDEPTNHLWLTEQNSQLISKSNDEIEATENATSNQNRKEQKRREAELRQQTAPFRKKIVQLEDKMDKYSQQLVEIENQLSDSELYNAENKEKLTALLNEQVTVKKSLEIVEADWMIAQETLEGMLNL